LCFSCLKYVWIIKIICYDTKLYYHYIGAGLVMPHLPHVGEADCNMVRGCRWPFTTCVMCELQRVWLGICSTTKLCYNYMGTGLVMPVYRMWGQANCNIVGGLHKAVKKTFVYRGGCRWLFTTCVMWELQQCDWAFAAPPKNKKSPFGWCLCGGKKGNDLLT
jgi:hypothetical protein